MDDNRDMKLERQKQAFSNRLNSLIDETPHAHDPNTYWGKLWGVSGTTAWNYRNGKKYPDITRAIEIAGSFGVSVEWLLTGKGTKRPGAALSPEEQILVVALANLSPAGKKEVLNYTAYILDRENDSARRPGKVKTD